MKLLAALVLACSLVSCGSTGSSGGAWTPLFDGRSFDGWTPVGGPYDGHARWTIEDGLMTGRQGPNREGGLIYTEAMYADFELEAEIKIDWPFDSGLFLRMVPGKKGMQVTIDHREDGECGGLYADGWVKHNPEGWRGFRRERWNKFRVRCSGQPMAIEAWLNGRPLVQHQLEDAEGYAREGRIGLQVHGENVPLETKVQFRNVRVRSLDG